MKIIAIPGSISTNSYNKKLARYIQKRYRDRMDIEILSLDDVPMFNVDIELDPPDIIKEYRKKILECDGIILITPEYNHSIPGVLKNALDWFSRVKRVMLGKPTMIVGASTGKLGTARAQIHLRQVLNSGGISAINLPGNEVLIDRVQEKMDDQGNVIHEPTIDFIDKVMDRYIDWVHRIRSSNF